MSATKGAILSLLLDAYQKRDRIAMVAFKGNEACVILPPTDSIDLGKKSLETLLTGGKLRFQPVFRLPEPDKAREKERT
jgi:magnesium chelatase subunit D